MNKKGIYTGIVGILAVMLIAGTLYFSMSGFNAQKIDVKSNAMQQMNLKMLNSYTLVQNAIVEAAGDKVIEDNCGTWTKEAMRGKIENYINKLKSPSNDYLGPCSVETPINIELAHPNIKVNNLVVSCSITGVGSISNTFSYEFGTQTGMDAGGACIATVIDKKAADKIVLKQTEDAILPPAP